MGAEATKNISMVKAIRSVLGDRRYFALFSIFAVVMFSLLFMIQVKTIPGNDIAFQARIFKAKDYALFVTLALLSALILTMQVKIWRDGRMMKKSAAGSAATGSVGLFSGILSSIFGTATCGMCVSALFGFLGAGTVISLVENRIYVVAGSIGLMLLSLHFSSKRLANTCESCRV